MHLRKSQEAMVSLEGRNLPVVGFQSLQQVSGILIQRADHAFLVAVDDQAHGNIIQSQHFVIRVRIAAMRAMG